MTFEDDKLNRKKYADFLTEIVTNSEKYKRVGDSASMSVAIDSGWGTGKTTFLDMWENELRGEDNFHIIRYNAWQNDFINDAFQSLAYCISNSNIFNEKNTKEDNKEKTKIFLKSCGKIAKKAGKFVANQLADGLGDAIEGVIDEGVKGIKDIRIENVDKFVKEYEEYFDAINEVKDLLSEVSKQKKILIIIDELDRCKPLFAIKLLECIKHIFDAQNIVFLFALDIMQLSHSIKCIYGQDMDANGYLSRFFDYISKMPRVENYDYIKYLVERNPLENADLVLVKECNLSNVQFVEIFYKISVEMNLSLRDINTIYSNFLIFEKMELKGTKRGEAYQFYLGLLCLKYKNSALFNQIFIDRDLNLVNNMFQSFNEYMRNLNLFNKKIINGTYVLSGTDVANITSEKLICRKNNKLMFKMMSDSEFSSHGCNINEFTSVSNILFYKDLMKFDEIKEKNILQYIQEKLEFFEFEVEHD